MVDLLVGISSKKDFMDSQRLSRAARQHRAGRLIMAPKRSTSSSSGMPGLQIPGQTIRKCKNGAF